jgi:hypothetical protein
MTIFHKTDRLTYIVVIYYIIICSQTVKCLIKTLSTAQCTFQVASYMKFLQSSCLGFNSTHLELEGVQKLLRQLTLESTWVTIHTSCFNNLCLLYIHTFHMILEINSDYLFKQH